MRCESVTVSNGGGLRDAVLLCDVMSACNWVGLARLGEVCK